MVIGMSTLKVNLKTEVSVVKGKYTLDEQIEAMDKIVTRLIKIEFRAVDRGIKLTDDFRNHVWAMRCALATLRRVRDVRGLIIEIGNDL